MKSTPSSARAPRASGPGARDARVLDFDGADHRRRQPRPAGLVTEPLGELVAPPAGPRRRLCVGPLPMMKAVAELTRPLGIPTWVSLNPIMIDGTGMCGGCRVTVGGEMQVRLRRRAGVRRPPGGLRRADATATRVTPTYERLRDDPGANGCASSREATAANPLSRKRPRQIPRAASAGADAARRASHLRRGFARLRRRAGARRGLPLPGVPRCRLHRRLPGRHRHPAASSGACGRGIRRRRPRASAKPTRCPPSAGASARRRRSARRLHRRPQASSRWPSAGWSASWPTGKRSARPLAAAAAAGGPAAARASPSWDRGPPASPAPPSWPRSGTR